MGQGRPTGTSLGAAQGSITINTSQLQQAQAHVAAASAAMTSSMNNINASTNQAQTGLSGLASTFRSLGEAMGISLSVAGAVQLGRAAVASAQLATAYNRQSVAARGLAGSQARLNELLDAYGKATGGVMDDATTLANVLQLQAVGFGKTADQLERFARAARGISIATGREQGSTNQQLLFEMANQTGFRLDQLGLSIEAVKARAEQLQAADKSLSKEMAYQNAILDEANAKFGKLTNSAIGQATGLERAAAAGKDFNLQIGQILGPALNAIGDSFAKDLERWAAGMKAFIALTNQAVGKLREMGIIGPDLKGSLASRTTIGRTTPQNFDRFTQDQSAAMVDWARGVADIERDAANDRLDATKQFEQQRSSTIREYNQTIAREAQDFATQRARAEADLADSIADIHADAARREVQQVEELARTIGQARADSAERLADMQEDLERTLSQRRADSADKIGEWVADRDEAIAERRKDSAARLLEIEQEYAEQRERSQRDHGDRLSDAAARLDANAVYEEQRRFRRESEDALAARDEQVSDEKTKLQEAIDQLNKAHQERLSDEKKALDKANSQAQEAFNRQVADEKEALDKRINQAKAAHAQQLADARAADAQRILDMQEDFAERIAQEDIDRGVRLGRLATDHNDQLTEMDRAHNERIAQIGRHAGEERKALDDEFQTRLGELELQTDAWITEQQRITDEAIKQFDKWWDHITGKTIIGPLPKNPAIIGPGDVPRLNPVQPGVNPGGGASPVQPSPTPYAAMAAFNYPIPPVAATAATGTGGNVTTLTIAPGAVVVYGAPGQSEERLADIIDQRLLHRIQQAAKGL